MISTIKSKYVVAKENNTFNRLRAAEFMMVIHYGKFGDHTTI